MLSPSNVLLALALVCFAIAAVFPEKSPPITCRLVAAGLLFITIAMMIRGAK